MSADTEHEWTTYRELDDGSEIELTVFYTITPYDHGCTFGPPESCYPPEGGEVDIAKVEDEDGNAIEPTDEEREKWSNQIFEQHQFVDERDYDDF